MKTKKKLKELEAHIKKLEDFVLKMADALSGKKPDLSNSPKDSGKINSYNVVGASALTGPTGAEPLDVKCLKSISLPNQKPPLQKPYYGVTGPCESIGMTGPTGPTELPKYNNVVATSAPLSCTGYQYDPELSSDQKELWYKYCKENTAQIIKSKLSMINYHLGPTGAGAMEYETLESSKNDSARFKDNFQSIFKILQQVMLDSDAISNPDMEEILIKLYGSYTNYNSYFAYYKLLSSWKNDK